MGFIKKTNQSADALVKVEGLWSFVDLFRKQWPFLLTVFTGGGVMSYLSAITDWLKVVGPFGWGIGFFLGCFLVLGVVFAWELVKIHKMKRQQISLSISKGFNPLLTRFELQKIPLPELFNPEYVSAKNKEFIDCDLYGPALLFATGCNFSGVGLVGCQIVIVREDVVSVHGGVMALRDSTILRGTMRNVTLLMTRGQFDQLPIDMRAHLPSIS